MSFGISAGTAALIGGGLAAAGSVYAANKSAGALKDSARDANDTQWAMYNQTRDDQAPYRAIGNSALAQLGVGIGAPLSNSVTVPQTRENFDSAAYLRENPDVADPTKWASGDPFLHWQMYGQKEGRQYDYTPEAQSQLSALSPSNSSSGIGLGDFNKKFSLADYQQDPGYQFRLDQGSQALERSAAARGGLLSGGTLKDLTNYQQGVASQEYGSAYNRFNNDQSSRFNRLAALAGIGQTSSNTLASVGANTADQVGNNLTGAGNATAAGYVGSANALSNGVSQGISAYQNKQLLSKFAPNSPSYISNGNTSGANYFDTSGFA